MKRFLRSKLVLTLAALIMIAAAVVIPLSVSAGRAHAQNPVPIPFSSINGAFFPNPNNTGTFDVNPSTSADFTQSFPIIAFNPPQDLQNCSNSTGVGETTVPFTDVVPNPDGSCSTVIAQGNGEQAGVAPLVAFETVFTATITVPSAGTLSSNILSDDGWIFSIGPNSNGAQPTPVTGNIMTNPPAGNKGPFTGYPEMGDNNTISGPTPFTIGVNFPAAGTYPVELDYTECCNNGSPNGVLALVVSNSFTPSPTPHNQLVIFLQGITTSLNSNQASNGVIVGMGTVPDTIKKVFPAAGTKPNANTRFLEYSYFISRTDNGLPGAYNCADTITNSLLTDILLLDKQIKNAFKAEPSGAQVDIYLVGHSLGGVVALGYLDFLEQKLGVSLPSGANLKAVITLDSPIGGVAKGFLSDFSALGGQILVQNCPAVKGQPLTAPKDLETIFGSPSTTTPPEPEDSGTNPQGSQASLLVLHGGTLPTPIPSNESLVENAQTDLGTSFLSIGNLNDFLFDPHACAGALPSFLDTMFLEDDGDGSGMYGRDFVSGPGTCPGVHNIKQTTQIVNTNHSAVLSDGNVQIGIKNFFTPFVSGNVGGTPSPLPVNPFQSPDS